MKTKRRICTFLQSDIYYALALGVILLTYGLNLYLNIVLYALFIINLGVNLRNDKFLLTFFALVIFETQVHTGLILSNWMLSSLIQVYYIAFAVRVVIDVFKRTRYKLDWIALLMALWFVSTAVRYQTSFSSGVLFMIKNGAVLLYILFYFKANVERDRAVGSILSTVALVMLYAGIYALSRSIYWDGRLGSTIHDPNYSAMFYGMGLFASFGATRLNKILRITISAAMVVLLLLTMSITGIFLSAIILAIYFLITAGIKRVAIVTGVLTVILAGILLMPTREGTTLGKLQNRVSKFYVIDENDYTLVGHDDYTDAQLYFNYITNNRYYLVQSYTQTFSELPTDEQLFGGNNVMTGPYRAKLEKKFVTVSHNSYIDMAFMVGAVFAALFLLLLVWRMVQLVREYHKSQSRPILCLLLLKAVVIIFGLTISYFPYRYFIVFIML